MLILCLVTFVLSNVFIVWRVLKIETIIKKNNTLIEEEKKKTIRPRVNKKLLREEEAKKAAIELYQRNNSRVM